MKFRDKADDVYRQGAIERGEFNPQGFPLRVYRYWAKHTSSTPRQENFCHFWRVVFFWAPLTAVRRIVLRVVANPVSWSVAGSACLMLFLLLSFFVDLKFLTFIVVPYVFIGFFFAVAYFESVYGKTNTSLREDRVFMTWLRITGLVSYPVLGLFLLGRMISLKWYIRVLIGIAVFLCLVIIVNMGVFLLDAARIHGITSVLLGTGAVLGGVLVLTLIVATAVWAVKRVQDISREAGREKDRKMMASWNGEPESFYMYKPKRSLVPRTVKSFFRAIADLSYLAFNTVRAKKWKICPLVVIPKDG